MAFALCPSIDIYDEDPFPKPVNKALMKIFKVIVLILTAVTTQLPDCGTRQKMQPRIN
jgi:hypothetical protein